MRGWGVHDCVKFTTSSAFSIRFQYPLPLTFELDPSFLSVALCTFISTGLMFKISFQVCFTVQSDVKRLEKTVLDNIATLLGNKGPIFYPTSPVERVRAITDPNMLRFYPNDVIILSSGYYDITKGRDDLMHYLSEGSIRLSYTTSLAPQGVAGVRGGAKTSAIEAQVYDIAVSRVFKCEVGVAMAINTFGCDGNQIFDHLMFHLYQRRAELLGIQGGLIHVTVTCAILAPLQVVYRRLVRELGWLSVPDSEQSFTQYIVMQSERSPGEHVQHKL